MGVICAELRLRALMEADAQRVRFANRHLRDGDNVGCAPSIKGKFKPGSAPARMFAQMVPGQAYSRHDAAAALGVTAMRGGEVLEGLVKAGHARRMRPADITLYVRDA